MARVEARNVWATHCRRSLVVNTASYSRRCFTAPLSSHTAQRSPLNFTRSRSPAEFGERRIVTKRRAGGASSGGAPARGRWRQVSRARSSCTGRPLDRKSTRLNSSPPHISYARFRLKKNKHTYAVFYSTTINLILIV